jgi:hypothetical protein
MPRGADEPDRGNGRGLAAHGNAVGYFLFAGEQHGFRQAANIKAASMLNSISTRRRCRQDRSTSAPGGRECATRTGSKLIKLWGAQRVNRIQLQLHLALVGSFDAPWE